MYGRTKQGRVMHIYLKAYELDESEGWYHIIYTGTKATKRARARTTTKMNECPEHETKSDLGQVRYVNERKEQETSQTEKSGMNKKEQEVIQ
jgi:hypothetical protein